MRVCRLRKQQPTGLKQLQQKPLPRKLYKTTAIRPERQSGIPTLHVCRCIPLLDLINTAARSFVPYLHVASVCSKQMLQQMLQPRKLR